MKLSLLPSAKPLKDRARLHFHCYTMETIADVLLYGKKQLGAGEAGYAQLRLAEPALLLPGDRFILRQFSPVATIGGGVVLDAMPLPRTKKEIRQSFLKALDDGDPQSILRTRIARRHHDGLPLSRLVAETGWTRQVLEHHLAEAARQRHVLRIGDLLADAPAIEGLKLFLASTVEDFHQRNPLVAGIGKEALRSPASSCDFLAAAW